MDNLADRNLDLVINERTLRAIKLIQQEAEHGRLNIAQVAETYKRRKEKQQAWQKRCKLENAECCSGAHSSDDSISLKDEVKKYIDNVVNKLEADVKEKEHIKDDGESLRDTAATAIPMLNEVTDTEVKEYLNKELKHVLNEAKTNLNMLEKDLNSSSGMRKLNEK